MSNKKLKLIQVIDYRNYENEDYYGSDLIYKAYPRCEYIPDAADLDNEQNKRCLLIKEWALSHEKMPSNYDIKDKLFIFSKGDPLEFTKDGWSAFVRAITKNREFYSTIRYERFGEPFPESCGLAFDI